MLPPMETPETIVPGAEPADANAAAEREERRTDGTPSDLLENTDDATIMEAFELLASGELPDAIPAEQPAAKRTPEAPETEQPEPEAEEIETAPPASPEANRIPRRLSTNGIDEQEAAKLADAAGMLRRKEVATLEEAFARLGLKAPTTEQQPESQAPPEVTAEPQTTPQVQTIKDQIASLRAERKQAKQDFDTDKEIELTERIEDLQVDLLRAEQSAKEAAQASQSFQVQYEAACDAIEAKYPELSDDNSRMSRILDDRIVAAKARGDKALANPNFILAMADEVAADLGITAGKPQPTAPKPAPTKPARPVGSTLAPGHQSAARVSEQEAIQAIRTMSLEDLDAAGEIAFGEKFGGF